MRNGLTLVELLVAIAIFTVIASVGTMISYSLYRQRAIFAERDNLVAVLRRARSEAMNNIRESSHGAYIASSSSQYVIFQGDTYAGRNAAYDETYPLSPAFTFGGLNEIDFRALDGQSSSGTVSIANGAQTLVVSIDSEGRVDW